MKLKVTNNWNGLLDKLNKLQVRGPELGRQIMEDAATDLNERVLEHLQNQGRGGEPPPLSGATRRLYDQRGEPDGSGIRDHLTLDFHQEGNRSIAVLGIPHGKPATVARVQDQGAIVPVSDAMRGFLAHNGIFLRADTTHIVVPARNFWSSSIRKTRSQTLRKLRKFFKEVTK